MVQVDRLIFEKLWCDVLRKYFREELGLEFSNLEHPPVSLNQVLGNMKNEKNEEDWAKLSLYKDQGKRLLPAFVADKTGYKFSGSTYVNRQEDLKTNKTTISAKPEFLLALAMILDFQDFDEYKKVNSIDTDLIQKLEGKVDSETSIDIRNLTATNLSLRRERTLWMRAAFMIIIIFIVTLGWFFLSKPFFLIPRGHILREKAHANTLTKGLIGNWYSYNRTYEARGLDDKYIFNRIAWKISADKDGYLEFNRHWKAMEFAGWIEFIEATSQLHFFINVYQNGNDYKDPIGFRHFNCGIWGENYDWIRADTLTCVCTTYNFRGSTLGEPLASREILIRQRGTSFDSLKSGATSLTIQEMPWLEKFLPKDSSYIYQKPRKKLNK